MSWQHPKNLDDLFEAIDQASKTINNAAGYIESLIENPPATQEDYQRALLEIHSNLKNWNQ